jgi:4-amino-4-deoxy-L-arabinose transferase-like glycosyltransferase
MLIAAYSAVVPAFEAPDEPGHFHYVERLAAGRGLPVQGANGDYDPELSQPPLYYALQALVARWVSPAGAHLPTRDDQNVFQNTTASGNVNLYRHPSAEGFPWSGELLQLHLMRLLNLPLAAITLLAAYGLAIELGFTPWLALTAAAALAGLPQFDFISGALNADNLIAATASLSLYLLVRWLERPSVWLALALGGACGAAMLSKLSGLAVLPFAAAIMLWRAWERSLRLAGQAAGACALALAAGGWWYVRNLALFGDALGWEPMLHAIGAMRRAAPLTPLQAAAMLIQQRATALGVFGWNNLRLPAWVYLAGDAVVGLALLGLGIRVVRHARRTEPQPPAMHPSRRAQFSSAALTAGSGSLWLLPLWLLLFAAGLVRWTAVNTDAAQWRLLLPAYPALATLIVLGLWQLVRGWVLALPAGLAVLSVASLLFVIRPAYMPDPPYGGSIQHPLSARFGDALELAGYDDPAPRDALPGQPVSIALYWRALKPIEEDDILHLAALDASGRSGWEESTWPEEGRAPTSGWRPGTLVRDVHLLHAPALAAGVWNLQLDVYRPLEGAPRLPINAAGNTVVNVGRFLRLPPQTAAASAQPEAVFGGNLALLRHRQLVSGNDLQVGLQWRAAGRVNRDYTVFVHLLDGAGALVAQNDSQPGGGGFPTSLLPVGVTVDDAHVLPAGALAPGDYQIEVGVYDASSGSRLRLQGSGEDAFRWPVTLP